MISIEEALPRHYPALVERTPQPLRKGSMELIGRLLCESDINRFLASHPGIEGFQFAEKVLEHFNLSYSVANTDRENIPATGPVVIIANHPLGALDALALLLMVSEVRQDIRIVANGLLTQLEPLKRLMLPVDNMGGKTGRDRIRRIEATLQAGQAVIIFPAGEVSRLRPNGVRDGKWHRSFLRFARRTGSPILPVHIQARNSALFYSLSMLHKSLASLMLVREMFHQQGNTLQMRIGELIPAAAVDMPQLRDKEQVRLFRRHLYRIGQGRKGLFATEKAIAHPQPRRSVKAALSDALHLGSTRDNKDIHLADYHPDSPLIKEIGRLREVTFRQVGEGTGCRRDLDVYDTRYRHLVLWDHEALELVGAYRLGESNAIMAAHGVEGFYSHSLFPFSEAFAPYLENALELGRSFVQSQYWGSRALDYLWQGLGAYLKQYPDTRYMFGPVSISNRYPQAARDLLVWFYGHYFPAPAGLVRPHDPYTLSPESLERCHGMFTGDDYEADFATLKGNLAQYGCTVPTLLKQYSELCETGGVQFLGFSIDPAFGDCLDAFILVDIERITPRKRQRYIGSRTGPGT
jgi:putative hemolysin